MVSPSRPPRTGPDGFRNALPAGIFLPLGGVAAETVTGGVAFALPVAGFLVPVADVRPEFVVGPGPSASADATGE